MPAPYPDDVCPPLQLGLPDLVDIASELVGDDATDDLIELMLAGRHYTPQDEGNVPRGSDTSSSAGTYETRRVFVNPLQGVDGGERGDCTLKGDFDSLIGFSDRIPLKVALGVFPVPSFKYTLKKPIFIDVPAIRNGKNVKVPAHKVANICIGEFEARSQVRMFFPRMVSDDGPPVLTQEDLATIYDEGILPTVREVIPEDLAHWPPSYKAAMTLYRDARGQLHFGKVDVAEYALDFFAESLCDRLSGYAHLADAYFQIELRGTKGMYQFLLDDPATRRNAFNLLTERLDIDSQEPESLPGWHVDIGVEVIRPYHVVQWTTAAHHRLLAHALPSLSPAELSKLYDGTNLERDISGHLFDLSGFRCHPGARGRQDDVVHVNVYTTDKTATYQPTHDGAFGPHLATDTFPGRMPRLLKNVTAMADVFAECAGLRGTTQDGTARFEIRVSAERALSSLTAFPEDLLNLSTVCIPNRVWWEYKYFRVAAINYVLEDLAKEPPQARALVPSLTLAASLTYMLNAVVSRPREWRAERHLAEVVVMRVPSDVDVSAPGAESRGYDPRDMVPVQNQQGLFFLCGILRDTKHPWWRLPGSHPMERAQLYSLYRAASLADIESNMGATGIQRVSRPANVLRLNNRRERTPELEFLNPEVIVPLNLALDGARVHVQGSIRLTGPDVMDVDGDEEDPDPDAMGPDVNLNDIIDRIWAQFGFDLIQVSPNNKNRDEPAYLSLSPEERLKVTVDLYKRPVFPFVGVWYRVRDNWDLQFERLFPPPDAMQRKRQNFASCRYYQLWFRLMSHVDSTAFGRIRATLRPLFDQLTWLPWTESDRLWDTRRPRPTARKDWEYLSVAANDGLERGVRIAINPRKAHPYLRPTLGHAFAEEEEEEDDDPRHVPPEPLPLAPGEGPRLPLSLAARRQYGRDTPRPA